MLILLLILLLVVLLLLLLLLIILLLLQRSGAFFMEGTVGTLIDACTFPRLDSNAITVPGYNRNVTISRNEIAWTGYRCT